MKIIRMTKDCAFSFLTRQHEEGKAGKLEECFENLMFREGAISILSRRTHLLTTVRFMPALDIENQKLKEQHPGMQGEAIRMMLMAPVSSGASLLGYFFVVDDEKAEAVLGKPGKKLLLEYGATTAAYRAFKGNKKWRMTKLKHTMTMARMMCELILLTQADIRRDENQWSVEMVMRRQSETEIWPEDDFNVVFHYKQENEKRKKAPDYIFWRNEDFQKLKPLSDRHVKWTTDWGIRIRGRLRSTEAEKRMANGEGFADLEGFVDSDSGEEESGSDSDDAESDEEASSDEDDNIENPPAVSNTVGEESEDTQ